MEPATVDERLVARLTQAPAPRDDFLPQLDRMDAARRLASGKDQP